MKTFHRICIKGAEFKDGEKTFSLKRGKEYLTTDVENGTVTVFSRMWVHGVEVEYFGGEIQFTKEK